MILGYCRNPGIPLSWTFPRIFQDTPKGTYQKRPSTNSSLVLQIPCSKVFRCPKIHAKTTCRREFLNHLGLKPGDAGWVYPPWVLTSSQAWSFASCWGLVNHPRWWKKSLVEIICITNINILSFVHMDFGNQVIYVSKVESSFGSLQIFGESWWCLPHIIQPHQNITGVSSQWTSWGWDIM